MARPLRLEFPGAFYHVTARGDGCEAIYLDASDFQDFLAVFEHVCERYNWRCHAWCLMTNHYHLVIETPDGNLSRGMRQLNGLYTRYFNQRHRRVGHVFQGRYKAILVDADAYLLELARYVVLNPVRASMVKTAGQWRWSSYRQMIGKAAAPLWFVGEQILTQFATQRDTAQRRYIQFVADGLKQSAVWKNLRNQIYLGDEQFVQRMQGLIDNPSQLLEVPVAQRRAPAQPLSFYAETAADTRTAMQLAYASGGYSLKVIGDYFGVHYSTVSRTVKS